MSDRTYQFIEQYDGLVGFGLDRETDEASLTCYLQMMADDRCMAVLRERLKDEEIHQLHNLITYLLKQHFSDDEYHDLFLKEPHEH
jgi:hypothetical protein